VLAEEAAWIKERIEALQLRPGAVVVDVGSSTAWFRTVYQPYIESELFTPLLARDIDIVHLDAKPDEGVDVVANVAANAALPGQVIGSADLTLCANLLEQVTDRAMVIRNLHAITTPGGYLIVTVPNRYPYHRDPIDTGFRPSPSRLAKEISPYFSVDHISVIDAAPRSSVTEDAPRWREAWHAPRLVGFKLRGNRMPTRVQVSGVVARRQR
jgi:SAM-dependent methyltransferase